MPGPNGLTSSRDKIKTLPELARILKNLRAKKKRVVHCHGVFDLLHIGHIRHFEQAKKWGDVLVVTVTPDQHVNKGPTRPVFKQDLRMEAIAALKCVDYVALNQTPMAVEAIKLLKPDFYAKGPDYKQFKKDITGGIDLERKAVEAVSGRLVITDDITFSSSNLINRHLPVMPKEASDYISGISRNYNADKILQYFKNAASAKALLVGEAIIDEYRFCEAIGKSSKEPMLALQHKSTEKFPGGILAVANHMANFCAQVDVVAYLGDRDSQEAFIRKNLNPNVRPHFIYKKNSPTIVKRRYIASYFFTKLLAIYEMNDAPLEAENNRQLCGFLKKLLPGSDLTMVVDFGHGMMSKEAIRILCDKSRFLAVNTQSNAGNQGYHTISLYPRADYVCMAENEFRLEARDRHKDLHDIVLDVSRKLHCPKVMVTRGKVGSLAYSKGEGFCAAPSLAGQVVDRMGAGDAFLALTAPCVMQKAPMEVVSFIGNVVGAQAVATVGHRSFVEKVPLFKHIETLLK